MPLKCCNYSLQIYELSCKLATYTVEFFIIEIVCYAVIHMIQNFLFDVLVNIDTNTFNKSVLILCLRSLAYLKDYRITDPDRKPFISI